MENTIRRYFFNCDERYIDPLSVVVLSLLKNTKDAAPTEIYVAHSTAFAEKGCCERVKSVVGKFPFAKVSFIDADATLGRNREVFESEMNKWSPLVWAGPLADELLPSVTGRIVYLDVDMLVLDDLGEFFTMDLGDALGAAVPENVRCKFAYLDEMEWDPGAIYYFNNGTMIIDLDRYRREGVSGQIIKWYAKHKSKAFATEQDTQNAVFGGRLLKLDVRWNCNDYRLYKMFLTGFFRRTILGRDRGEIAAAIVDPGIVHYMHRKPWNYSHRPTRALYHAYMKELGIFRPEIAGTGLGRRIESALYDFYFAVIRGLARLMMNPKK